MILKIRLQSQYSRSELLLRRFFGWLYLYLPHEVLLMFMSIASVFVTAIAWIMILLRSEYPKNLFRFQIALIHWRLRVRARFWNLRDGFPPFGFYTSDKSVTFFVPYRLHFNKRLLVLKTFLGFIYCIFPHYSIILLRTIWALFLKEAAFWVVFFTGKYPQSFFDFILETMVWKARVDIYMSFLSDDYPPFHGKKNYLY